MAEPTARRSRGPGLIILRAVVVLAIAGAGYQALIPVTHVDRTRLARLVVNQPGVKEFNVKPARSAAQSAPQSGLSVLVDAARKSPDSTGLYATEWMGTKQQAMEVAAFLTPNEGDARRLYAELAKVSLGASAGSSVGLTRMSTYTTPGVPGSSGSVFAMATQTGSTPALAAMEFRYGNVVALEQGAVAAASKTDVAAMATVEYRHLASVEPGFSLTVTDHPVLATSLWAALAVAVAAVAAFGPVAFGRVRERRRQRRADERDRIVRGHAITKTRRAQGS